MASQDAATAALQDKAEALLKAARTHKKAEFQHRKQARELMRRLAVLQRVCVEHGIELETSTDPQGGHSDD